MQHITTTTIPAKPVAAPKKLVKGEAQGVGANEKWSEEKRKKVCREQKRAGQENTRGAREKLPASNRALFDPIVLYGLTALAQSAAVHLVSWVEAFGMQFCEPQAQALFAEASGWHDSRDSKI